MIVAATSNFLLPNATIIPEFIAFLVILGVITKYVLPPLKKAMDERQQNIAQSLLVIDEAKARQAGAEAEARRVVDQARQEARSIVDNANRVAEDLQTAGRQRGDEEYARTVGKAQGEIERSRRAAEAELVTNMADLVIAAAEAVVETEIDPERHRALIDEAIAAAGSQAAADAGSSPVASGPGGTLGGGN